MSKKFTLKTLAASLASVFFAATAFTPAVFAYAYQDNEITPNFDESKGLVSYEVNHHPDWENADTATLTITPNSGYKCESISASYWHYGTYSIEDLNCENTTFELPAFTVWPNYPDVTVNVTFTEETYPISIEINDKSMGSVTTTPAEEAVFNSEVTLDITPNEGYKCDSVVSKYPGDLTCESTSFTMPSHEVDIYVNFVPISTPEPTPEPTPTPAPVEEKKAEEKTVAPNTGSFSPIILLVVATSLILGGTFVAKRVNKA